MTPGSRAVIGRNLFSDVPPAVPSRFISLVELDETEKVARFWYGRPSHFTLVLTRSDGRVEMISKSGYVTLGHGDKVAMDKMWYNDAWVNVSDYPGWGLSVTVREVARVDSKAKLETDAGGVRTRTGKRSKAVSRVAIPDADEISEDDDVLQRESDVEEQAKEAEDEEDEEDAEEDEDAVDRFGRKLKPISQLIVDDKVSKEDQAKLGMFVRSMVRDFGSATPLDIRSNLDGFSDRFRKRCSKYLETLNTKVDTEVQSVSEKRPSKAKLEKLFVSGLL